MLGRVGAIATAVCQQQRGMATLKSISMRLKSVKNIKKITQSMKMVAAAKYARADRELRRARPYGEGAKLFYKVVEVTPPKEAPKKLIIAMTSDRGLCGGCHTGIARLIRKEIEERHEHDNTKIICVGEKAKSLLQSYYSKNIILVVSDIGRLPSTFLDAGRLTSAIIKCDYPYNDGKIVFNKIRTIVSYIISTQPIYALGVLETAPKLMAYEMDGDILQSYMEYSMASLIYFAMKEGACSEQSARMSAMGNACTNAEEMISKLSLLFNRTRQAVITRELTEIISGAAAL